MAARYHISDDGMPGKCRAASSESCPKTKAGDGFHGTLEEAAAESEQRFEKNYGSTMTLGSTEQKARWNLAAAGIQKENTAIYRGSDLADLSTLNAVNAEVDSYTRFRLSQVHGVKPIDVSATGDHYIVAEENGTRRVYGSDRNADFRYLGVLHPKLTQPASFSSEHKAMVGDRDAEDRDYSSNNPNLKFYGYGSVALKGVGTVEFTSDPEGSPVDKQVWESIDSTKVPRELFEDESLRRSMKSRGILKD